MVFLKKVWFLLKKMKKDKKSTFLPFLVMEDVFLCFEDFEKVENMKNMKKSKTSVFFVFLSEEVWFFSKKHFSHTQKKDTFFVKRTKDT